MFANSLIIYNYTIKKLVHNLKDDLKENSFLFENEMLVRKLEKYSDPFISTTVKGCHDHYKKKQHFQENGHGDSHQYFFFFNF